MDDSTLTEVVAMVRDKKRLFESQCGTWRQEARENYDVVAGDGRQWDPKAKKALDDANRPAVEFNRVGTIIDAVSGSEVSNRQETTYLPRIPGNVQQQGIGMARTAAARWVRDNCDAEDEESDAFVDVLVSGMGFTGTRMDYEEEPDGKIVIERIDPLTMGWDASARKRNLSDAKCIWRECKYSREEVEERWPDKADEIVLAPQSVGDEDEDELRVVDARDAYNNPQNKPGGYDGGKVEVTQFQWYEVEHSYQVLGPTGIVELPQDRFEVLQQMDPAIQYAKIPKRVYMQAFVAGSVELEVSRAPCQCGFTFQAITGKRDRNKGYFYGLVRPMKDPQRWANKFFSQVLHIINTNAKGGLMVEAGAVANQKKFENEWAAADSITWLQSGGLGKIQPKQPGQVPQSIPSMMEFSISSIRDCGGVNLELLGMADRQQAGVLEAQRTRSGLTILAPFFDSMRLYRKRHGRVLAYFINEYISDGRLIRVLGQDGEAFVPLMKQPDDIEYDVVVDSAPTSRDTKEQTWIALREILPAFQAQGIPPPPEVFDYLPVPQSLAQLLKAAYMKKMQEPNPMQGAELQYKQAEIANKTADTEQKESAAAKNYMDAGQIGVGLLAQLFGPGMGSMGQQPVPGPQTIQ